MVARRDRNRCAGAPDHSALLAVAEKWLKGTMRCDVVLLEQPHAYMPEIPDAIGWASHPRSGTACHVVECKVSVADCHRDKKKRHAKWGESMGDFRWVLAPSGVLTPNHLPPMHGLIELRGSRVFVVKHAPPRDKTWARLEAEVTYLRVELSDVWREIREKREAS